METRDGFQNKSIIKLTKYKFHYIIPIILLFKEKNGWCTMKTNVFVQFLYPFLPISSITFVIQMLKIELAESCLNIEMNHIKNTTKLYRIIF